MTQATPNLPRRQALTVLAGGILLAGAGTRALAAPQTVMIFFDFEMHKVTPSAKDLVKAIAALVRSGGKLTLAGHCDTGEKNSAKLSLTRAVEVLNALADVGVPVGAAITVVGKGTVD